MIDAVESEGPGAEDASTDRDPVPVGVSLDAVVRSLRGPDRRQIGGLFGGWDEVVGPQIAAHVRPVRLDDGVLIVEVDDPAWATQVQLLSNTVRQRLVDDLGIQISELRVRVARAR